MRERLSLDGDWDFRFLPDGPWRRTHVPGAWQSPFDDLERHTTGLYRLTFDVPAGWAGSAACLHFGAADYLAEAWLNGARLGGHEGGYLPFEFDVSVHLRPGQPNELTVQVTDPGDDPQRTPGLTFAEIPHGKQSWYGPVSGLWQSVWLERRAPAHVQGLMVTPNPAAGRVAVRLTLPAAGGGALQAHLRVLDAQSHTAASLDLPLPAGQTEASAELDVPNPLWWSPDRPHLYRLEAALIADGREIDTFSQTFGFRTIEARDGALFLNGERLYLRGALDQDYYPGTFYTPPSAEFIEAEMRQAKELGLNCLRCHIKVADPAYLDAADRLGLLIWAELPNWRHFGPATSDRGRATLEGMLARDGHHPAIIAWTIINEGWGLDLVGDERHRAWLQEMYAWLKTLDPTRLVVDNSACEPNFHLQTDLDDFHWYAALPDHRQRWDDFVEDYAGRPAWTFSPAGDAVRTGREPLLVSEFGNWGLPDVAGLLEAGGREPWWFETGLNWGDGVVYPHRVLQRFYEWSLDQVFGTYAALAAATQWQQFAAMKYEIEAMRRQPAIVGYVITEFTDVHWECNGLLDMRRNPKAYHSVFAQVNADTVLVPRWERIAYWAGETVTVEVSVAHGAGAAIAGATLAWQLGDAHGHLEVPPVAAGEVITLAPIQFTAPDASAAAPARLELALTGASGQALAVNHLALSFFPRPPKPAAAPLFTADPALAEYLAALGYTLAASPTEADILVTRQVDADLLAAVRAGARLLILAETPEALGPGLPALRLKARQGTIWEGDWASSFAWVRRTGPWAALPGGPLLDFSFDRVIPDVLIQGLNPEDFEQRVPAGLFVGWVHKPVGLIATRACGLGQVVLSTFRLLRDSPAADPVAAHLLSALIQTTLES